MDASAAKVGYAYSMISPWDRSQQNVAWLQVPVDKPSVVNVLQACHHLSKDTLGLPFVHEDFSLHVRREIPSRCQLQEQVSKKGGLV